MAVKRRAEAYWVEARKRWQINVQREGQRKCFTDYTTGKKGKHSCEEKADRWLLNFSSEQPISNAFDLYLQDKKDTTSPSTFNNTLSRIKKIRGLLTKKRMLSTYNLKDWQDVIDALSENGMSEETIKLFKVTIINFIAFCEKNNWVHAEIKSEQLIIRKGKKAKTKEAYSIEEIRVLMSEELDEIWHINFFRLLLFTGFRKNELCALKWQDIDFDLKTINVQRGVDSLNNETSGKTENVIRCVALTSYAERVLQAQKSRQIEARIITPYVFAEKSGQRIAYAKVSGVFDKLKDKGIKHTIHELRHTFISITDKELPLAVLKKSIGHSASMDTQKTYSHTTKGDIDQMRKGVEKAFDDII